MNTWGEDIKTIRDELPKCHKNLFYKRAKGRFEQDIDKLLSSINDLNVFEMRIEIARIIASIKDAHTSINLPVSLLCPVEFYWFSDGIYVIDIAQEYSEILYAKVRRINGMEINNAIAKLSEIISYENEYLFKALLPKYLPAIELLSDLYIVDSVDMLELECELKNGETKSVYINAVRSDEARDKLPQRKLQNENILMLPLYRRMQQKAYWYEFINDFETVYFKYNSCRDMEDISLKGFCKEITNLLSTKQVRRLVVDLRNNKGGDSTLLDEFIDEISRNPTINKNGALYVIIGRDTFSSALLNAYSFKEKTKALLVGEPTGGKPNCYGEVESLHLKNSGLVISYSTKYYKVIEDDDQMSLIPDISCEITIDDYMNNLDPCMEYLMKLCCKEGNG